MKPMPAGRPRISAGVRGRDAAPRIGGPCAVGGFELRLKADEVGGRIEHGEPTDGDGVVRAGEDLCGTDRGHETGRLSPLDARCNTR